MKNYPKVLLIGRTNVGKSTIFNRLSNKTQSIVFDREGVTRDYLTETVTWDNKKFDLVDTGGISLKKENDPILEKVREKVLALVNKSSVILFVCDIKNGLTQKDIEIAKELHKTKKTIFLLLNKADNQNLVDENIADFYSLNIKEIIPISALHGKGFADLLEKIEETLNKIDINEIEEDEESKPKYKVVILGKPNVGKSSLINILTKKERSIVCDVAGTTREALSEFTYCSQDFIELTDTAGIRRQKKVTDDLESLMVKSSFQAVRESDIIILLVDSSELKLSDQELKLLFYAYEEKKSVILVFNKMDLLTEDLKQELDKNLREYRFILKKLPILGISCKTKNNVTKIFKELTKVWQRRNQEIDPIKLSEIVLNYWLTKPMFHNETELKLYKIRQVQRDMPTFLLKVNYPEWFGQSQLGLIENILRKNFDFKGCPIKFIFKKDD